MTEFRKFARFQLAVAGLAAVAVVSLYAWSGNVIASLAGFALLALMGLRAVFLQGSGARPVQDERDDAIQQRATVAGYVALWLALVIWGTAMPLVFGDRGTVPLVWVVPLALFLMTFILVFTNRPIASMATLRLGYLLGLAGLAAVFSKLTGVHVTIPAAVLTLVAFFLTALYAHALLADSVPGKSCPTFIAHGCYCAWYFLPVDQHTRKKHTVCHFCQRFYRLRP